jgi:hypothetical protein
MAIIGVAAVAVLAGATVFVASHHVVNTRDGLKTYPKSEMSFAHSYTDMTRLTFFELRNYRPVVAAMAKAGDLRYVPGGAQLVAVRDAGEAVARAVGDFDDEHRISETLKRAANAGAAEVERLNLEEVAGRLLESTTEKARSLGEWLRKNAGG